MSVPTQSIIGTRRHQMFPTLEPAEIERLRRFGEARSFSAGEALVKVGEVGHGLTIILAGQVDNAADSRRPLETSRRGVFAIGDVRSSSVKRVAAAVGEGAQVVATLHAFLAAADQEPAFKANA